jgi:hypothetical protein
MVVVALTSIFASFTEKANCKTSRRNRLLSRDGATAAVASAALGVGTAP